MLFVERAMQVRYADFQQRFDGLSHHEVTTEGICLFHQTLGSTHGSRPYLLLGDYFQSSNLVVILI